MATNIIISFPAGSRNDTSCATIPIINNGRYENSENFTVNIETIEDNVVVLGSRNTTVEILDDEGLLCR